MGEIWKLVMDREAWLAAIHGVTKSRTRLSDWTELNWTASLVGQLVKNLPAMQETLVWFLSLENLLEKDRLLTTVFLGFPCDSAGKESACNAGDLGLIPGLGRSPGEGNGYPLQDSHLENSMDSIFHGVAKSWTWLRDYHKHCIQKYYLLSYITVLRYLSWQCFFSRMFQNSLFIHRNSL